MEEGVESHTPKPARPARKFAQTDARGSEGRNALIADLSCIRYRNASRFRFGFLFWVRFGVWFWFEFRFRFRFRFRFKFKFRFKFS